MKTIWLAVTAMMLILAAAVLADIPQVSDIITGRFGDHATAPEQEIPYEEPAADTADEVGETDAIATPTGTPANVPSSGNVEFEEARAADDVRGEVFTSEPLSSGEPPDSAALTSDGIIFWTNFQRAGNGLSGLSPNSALGNAARAKISDMFDGQYFAHTSPSGKDIGDVAKDFGYKYLIVGENLALGDFGGDRGVVLAWMDSPGHRANILNVKYTEIGVAVGRGVFQGRETWLAVQVFGLPLSYCPQIDPNLKATVEQYESQIRSLEKTLTEMRAEISLIPYGSVELSQKISEYNELVAQYNNIITVFKAVAFEYNGQVKTYNSCVNTALE